ncbi:hypothetical protein IAE37_002537 [Pseudomonas sp. S31]|uniref:hypothetical protein n=1 Tax=Pseudomonas sp. S31 TaxID=1564473 RepID=UPI001913FC7A|nr:hypothetical protein [Pseudomonas sp. S31]MBK5000261.1 hypothetical protein [Pseudomonas sp. S31]
MLDKFLFSLSLDYFVACMLPKSSAKLHKQISTCAKQEILAILKGHENYYKTDLSTERLSLSKARLTSGIRKDSLHPTAISYITTMLDLFDTENKILEPINVCFAKLIDQTLILGSVISNPTIYSAIEKLHENHIYTHSSINNQWALDSIFKDASSWTKKMHNPLMFDGIEDALENIVLDVLDYFPLLSFIGSTNFICNQQETNAIIDHLTLKSLQLPDSHSEFINQITAGLTLRDTVEQQAQGNS